MSRVGSTPKMPPMTGARRTALMMSSSPISSTIALASPTGRFPRIEL